MSIMLIFELFDQYIHTTFITYIYACILRIFYKTRMVLVHKKPEELGELSLCVKLYKQALDYRLPSKTGPFHPRNFLDIRDLVFQFQDDFLQFFRFLRGNLWNFEAGGVGVTAFPELVVVKQKVETTNPEKYEDCYIIGSTSRLEFNYPYNIQGVSKKMGISVLGSF